MDAVIGDQWEDASTEPFGTATVFRGSSSGLTPNRLIRATEGSNETILLVQFGGSIVQ